MKALLILLVATAGIVLLASYIGQLWRRKKGIVEEEESNPEPMGDCCGAHEICEVDLLNKMSEEIIYYEDEDLDAYKNFEENDYNDEQIDEFRDVLYSLKEKEIEGWIRSLELRKIEMPSVIKSELVFMLVKH
ncbi:phospholipase [Ancylomarina longa]|uniref:Phospholipase n=1 Tax=Ancylomarina longa TaxID=2487017 RepID=A0A434AXF6_9BACT|nr:phospholipase [Ancylomarina longa]RUT79212.1 phospholipase [Ancylomarina longa]